MRNRIWFIIGGVLLVLVVGGGAFYGGRVFERSRVAGAQAAFFTGRGGGMAGDDGGFPMEGPRGNSGAGTFGTVKSVEGDDVLVSTPQDVTTMKLTETTTIQKLVPGDRSDLQPGQQMTVRGERDAAGNVTAATIQILGEAP